MVRDDDSCRIQVKLQEVHLWTHACVDAMEPEELRRSQEVAQKIIDLLNELPHSHPVKFMAAYEVICTGVRMLEFTTDRGDSTATIH